MTPTVPATEPVPETCGEAFNSAWQCYGASTSRSVVQRDRRATDLDAPANPLQLTSPNIPADAILPIRRARLVRGTLGRHLGVHGQEQEARARDRTRARVRHRAKISERRSSCWTSPHAFPSDPTLMRCIPPHSSLNRAEMDRA